MRYTGDLDGKVAFVTGGSSGIGAASVRLLADAGAKVVIGYHQGPDRADALKAELPGSGHSTSHLSLADTETAYRALQAIKDEYGRLDVLVNSAGFTTPIPHRDLERLDDGLFAQILLANVGGPFSVIRAAMPLLRQAPEAVVVSVSSISAFTGSGSNIAYCVSKAALDTMTMSMARVFGPNVRFLCVSPGAVATGFVAGRDRAALEEGAQSTPLARVVEPEDVAHAIMACVVQLKLTTGARVIVDGGRHL